MADLTNYAGYLDPALALQQWRQSLPSDWHGAQPGGPGTPGYDWNSPAERYNRVLDRSYDYRSGFAGPTTVDLFPAMSWGRGRGDIPSWGPDLLKLSQADFNALLPAFMVHADDPTAMAKAQSAYAGRLGNTFQEMQKKFPGFSLSDMQRETNVLNPMLESFMAGAQPKSAWEHFGPGFFNTLAMLSNFLGPYFAGAMGPAAAGAGAGVGTSTVGGLTVPGSAYIPGAFEGFTSAVPAGTLATAPLGGLAGGLGAEGLSTFGNLSVPGAGFSGVSGGSGITGGGGWGLSDYVQGANVGLKGAELASSLLTRGTGASPSAYPQGGALPGGPTPAQLSAIASEKHPGLVPYFVKQLQGVQPPIGIASLSTMQQNPQMFMR